MVVFNLFRNVPTSGKSKLFYLGRSCEMFFPDDNRLDWIHPLLAHLVSACGLRGAAGMDFSHLPLRITLTCVSKLLMFIVQSFVEDLSLHYWLDFVNSRLIRPIAGCPGDFLRNGDRLILLFFPESPDGDRVLHEFFIDVFCRKIFSLIHNIPYIPGSIDFWY